MHPAVPVRITPCTQPKGRSSPQLIPEFLCVEKVAVEQLPTVDHKRCLCHNLGNIPSGSKLLRTEANWGNTGKTLCIIGIYRSMQQFVTAARQLWHPFDELRNMPDLMVRALFTNLTSSPHQIFLDRCKFLKKWSTIARAASNPKSTLFQVGCTEHSRTSPLLRVKATSPTCLQNLMSTKLIQSTCSMALSSIFSTDPKVRFNEDSLKLSMGLSLSFCILHNAEAPHWQPVGPQQLMELVRTVRTFKPTFDGSLFQGCVI